MAQAVKELQQMKGIGKVLAQRLKGAGIGNYQEVIEAGEDGLKKIPGIKARAIASILNQARELSERRKAAKAERVEAMKGRTATLRDQVNALAEGSRERFGAELDGKSGRKLTSALEAVVELLTSLNDSQPKRLKRAERGLDKVERRLAGLDEANIRKIRKGLKKSRKALRRAAT